jgi:hypothetical protein
VTLTKPVEAEDRIDQPANCHLLSAPINNSASRRCQLAGDALQLPRSWALPLHSYPEKPRIAYPCASLSLQGKASGTFGTLSGEPLGGSSDLRIQFNLKVSLEFYGATIASDGGLLAVQSWMMPWALPTSPRTISRKAVLTGISGTTWSLCSDSPSTVA